MDIKKLIKKVKPELNHIYTEKPFMTQQCLDLGLFCREHALHLYGLAVLLGMDAEICTGDHILFHPDRDRVMFSTVDGSSDHAWCRIADNVPVDVSFTIKYLYKDIKDILLLHAGHPELYQPFTLIYFSNETDANFKRIIERNEPLVGYNEKSHEQYDLLALLKDPFQFLLRPPLGTPSLIDMFGNDVFFSITYHCYRLVTEEINPLFTYRDPKSTIKGILKFNKNAKKEIINLLSS